MFILKRYTKSACGSVVYLTALNLLTGKALVQIRLKPFFSSVFMKYQGIKLYFSLEYEYLHTFKEKHVKLNFVSQWLKGTKLNKLDFFCYIEQ